MISQFVLQDQDLVPTTSPFQLDCVVYPYSFPFKAMQFPPLSFLGIR